MDTSIERMTAFLNAYVGGVVKVLRDVPYTLPSKILSLHVSPHRSTELPVVVTHHCRGESAIWITVSMDLQAALAIADRMLNSMGRYSQGLSEYEQLFLKGWFETTVMCFYDELPEFVDDLVTGVTRIDFGHRVFSAPKGWPLPFVVELGTPKGQIQIDVAWEHGPSADQLTADEVLEDVAP